MSLPSFGSLVEQSHLHGNEIKTIQVAEEDENGPTGNFIPAESFTSFSESSIWPPKGLYPLSQLIHTPLISHFGRAYNLPTKLTLKHISRLFRLYLANLGLMANGNFLLDTSQIGDFVIRPDSNRSLSISPFGRFDTHQFSQRYDENALHPPFGSVVMKKLLPTVGRFGDRVLVNTNGSLFVEDYQNHSHGSNSLNFYTGAPIDCPSPKIFIVVGTATVQFNDENGCPVFVGDLFLDIDGKKYAASALRCKKFNDHPIPGLAIHWDNFQSGDSGEILCWRELEALFTGGLKINGSDGWLIDPSSFIPTEARVVSFFENIPKEANFSLTNTKKVIARLDPNGWPVSSLVLPNGYIAEQAVYKGTDPTHSIISLEAPTWLSDLYNIFLSRMWESYSPQFTDFPTTVTWAKKLDELFENPNPTDLVIPRTQSAKKYGGLDLLIEDIEVPRFKVKEIPDQITCDTSSPNLREEGCFNREVDNPPVLDTEDDFVTGPDGLQQNIRTNLQTGGSTLVKKGHIYNAHAALETWFGTTIFGDHFDQALVFDASSAIRTGDFHDELTSIEDMNPNDVFPVKGFAPTVQTVTMIKPSSINEYQYLFTDGTFVYRAESRNKELISVVDVPGQATQQGESIGTVEAIYSAVNSNLAWVAEGTTAYLFTSYGINNTIPVSASTLGISNFVFYWDNDHTSLNDYVKWQSFMTGGNQWKLWTAKTEPILTTPWEAVLHFDLSNLGDNLIGGQPGRVTTLQDHALFPDWVDREIKVARQNRLWAWTQENELVNAMEVPTQGRTVQDDENVYYAGTGITRNKVCLAPMHRYFNPEDTIDIAAFTKTHDYGLFMDCKAPGLMRAAVDIKATKRVFANGEEENVGEGILWDNVKLGFNVVPLQKDYTKFQEIRGFKAPTWKDVFGTEFESLADGVIDNGDGTATVFDSSVLFAKNGCRDNREFIRDNWHPEPMVGPSDQLVSSINTFSIIKAEVGQDKVTGEITVKLPTDVPADAIGQYSITDYSPVAIPTAIWYHDNTLSILTNFGNFTKNLYVIKMDVQKAKDGEDNAVVSSFEIEFPEDHIKHSEGANTHIVKDFSWFENEYYLKIITIPDNKLANNAAASYYKVNQNGGVLQPLFSAFSAIFPENDAKTDSICSAIIPTRMFGELVYITNNPGIPTDPLILDDNPSAILDSDFNRHVWSDYFQPPVGSVYQFISAIDAPTTADRKMFRLEKTVAIPDSLTSLHQIVEFRDNRFDEAYFEIVSADRSYRFNQGERTATNTNRCKVISSTPYVGGNITGGGMTDLFRYGQANDEGLSVSSSGVVREFRFEQDALVEPDNKEWWPKQAYWNEVFVVDTGDFCTMSDLKSRSFDGGLLDTGGQVCLEPLSPLSIETGYTPGFIRGKAQQNIVFDDNGDIKTVIKCLIHNFDISSEALLNTGITTIGSKGNHYDGRYFWAFDGSQVRAEDFFQAKVEPTSNHNTFNIAPIVSIDGKGLTNLETATQQDVNPHSWLKSKGYIGYDYVGPWDILDWKPDGAKAICKITISGRLGTNLAYMDIDKDAEFGEPIWILDDSSLANTLETITFGRHGSFDERYEFVGSFAAGNRGLYRWVPGTISILTNEHALPVGGTACVGGGPPDPVVYSIRDGFCAAQWFEKGVVATSCCLQHFGIFSMDTVTLSKEYKQPEGKSGALECCGTPVTNSDCVALGGVADRCAFPGPVTNPFSEFTAVGIFKPTLTKNSDHWMIATRTEIDGTGCPVTVHYFVENGNFINRQETASPSGTIYGMDPAIVKYDGSFYRFAVGSFIGDGTDADDDYQRKGVGSTVTETKSFFFATAGGGSLMLNKNNITRWPLDVNPKYFLELE